MAYADKCYVGKRVKLGLLDDAEVRQIHEATLDVIENVGVKYHSQAALDILEANGAAVDRETTVAKIPADVVERAMSTVPEQFVLGARNPEYDLPLDGEHIYISSDGCGVFFRDPTAASARRARRTSRTARGWCRPWTTCPPRPPSSRPRTARPRPACCTSSTPACATRRSTTSS